MKQNTILFVGCSFIFLWKYADTSYLSYKKDVTQSSVFGGYHGRAVTDGNDYTVMGSTCYHSHDNSEEFLKIDLSKEYNVTKVTIINRVQPSSGSHYRLAQSEVRIGNVYDDLRNAPKCGMSVTTEQVERSAIIDLECGEPISGRYVMLWHPTIDQFLNVCEVRVYNEYEPEISECTLMENKNDYRGLVHTTTNNILCQTWTSNSPHVPYSGISIPNSETGLGHHNLCRNPDNEPGAWCYTSDANVRWEYCDVADTGSSCPLSSVIPDLSVLRISDLSLSCLQSWFASTNSVNLNSDCLDDNIQSLNHAITIDSQSVGNEVTALTVTMYIYPNEVSSGEILSTINGDTHLKIEQTYSNNYLYHSEVTVSYNDQEITKAHVLLPNVWTFIAITFDGSKRNFKLWRDGEIASIAFTDFDSMDLDLSELQLGSSNDDLFARVAALQVYSHALNEVEIKAAKDKIFENWPFDKSATFSKVVQSLGITGSQLYEGTDTSALACSKTCVHLPCCKAFKFNSGTNSCIAFSQSSIDDRVPGESDDIVYYQKQSQSYPLVKYC
ncbi:uncharacterized protein [Antedon mediterranea]|uniref:uncharacterized protein n=1 Tax=Antedon mediterranea TaxID=105859 RepID=UPI003AF57EC0